MENMVHYGQYSLTHWLELLLKQNIVLPEYQRYFVWDEKKVITLIDTIKKKQFVPPITIGAFKNADGTNVNLILDGQQRLTSILLAHLGLYPDSTVFKETYERMANDNDDEPEELDTILNWDLKKLTEKGRDKAEILSKIITGNYKNIDFQIDDGFLKKHFLGFSYLVPHITDKVQQQKYYSSVFRNINIQGERLLPQESRASLYYLRSDLKGFFDPQLAKRLTLKSFSSESKADLLRFLALLSQYAKDGNSARVARGYKPNMEKYYETYIYSVVGEANSMLFKDFEAIFPTGDYASRFTSLDQTITDLGMPVQFTSIIEMDMYLFGLIYTIVFQGKQIDTSKSVDLIAEIEGQIEAFKADEGHKKSPNALKYLKARIDQSINTYQKYLRV